MKKEVNAKKEAAAGKDLFPKFGRFSSWKELNRAAEAQKNEGDLQALKDLAKENGLDAEDAEDYYNGDLTELASPLDAASARLEVEERYLKVEGALADCIQMIKGDLMEGRLEPESIMRKDLAGALAAALKLAYSKPYTIPKEIVKAAGITVQYDLRDSTATMAEYAATLREYYGGEV